MTGTARLPKRGVQPAWSKSAGRLAEGLWSWVTGLLADPGIRTGIKFALAGTLSLYFALLIRLDQPTWAVTTAFVLSTPKFVGAIAEKTLLRIVGALAGAVIGYLITGSLEQSPVLFLALMGTLVAFTTAMFGGTLVPYGFRQAGYTATLVASQGLANPDFSWKIGLARCEEILLGLAVTTVVTTLVWPRYARVEFGEGVRRTLGALGEQFALRSAAFLSGGAAAPEADVLGKVGGNLAKLRKLISFGCFESTEFRRRRPQIDAIVCELGVLSASISNIARTLPTESHLRPYVERQIADLHDAILETIECLAGVESDAASRRAAVALAASRLDAYRSALLDLRRDGIAPRVPAMESIEHGGYLLAITEIHDALGRIANLMPEIEAGQSESFPAIDLKKFTPPSPEWIRSGIRAGLALVISLILLDWLHPPGTDMLVVGTYLFTGFSLESPDRKGDLGVFSELVFAALGCLLFFVFLLVFAPLMSSYAVMNTVLGTALFVTGYLTEKSRLSTFTSIFLLLIVVNLVGVNAQHPVAFSTILDASMGILLAAILSAVIRRLLWPALPQRELKKRISHVLSLLAGAAAHPQRPVPVSARADLALSVADAVDLARTVGGRQWPADELARFETYLRSLGRLGGHQISLLGQSLPPFPAEVVTEYSAFAADVSSQVKSELAHQQKALTEEAPPAPEPLDGDFSERAAGCRSRIRSAGLPPLETVTALGILYRQVRSAAVAAESTAHAAAIDFRKAFADSRL